MATPDIETYNKYYGNGETTEFSVSFPYSKREYVKVYVRRVGFEQVSVDPKDYEFVNDKTIRYPSNTSSDDILRDGDIITIQRETTVASEFIFSNQKRLFPEDVMNADDLSFEILQEQARELERAIIVDPTSEVQPKVLLEKVDLVYNRIDDIETVAQNIDSVDNVSKNIGVVSDVSAIKEEVKELSDNMGAVLGVHANEGNINVVKENDAGIRLVADNIDAVLDAPNQAESARRSAERSEQEADRAERNASIQTYRNIGDIFFTARLDTELNGAVECNGGTYSVSDFTGEQAIGNLFALNKVPYVSLSDYQTAIDTNGSCRAFGWDGGDSFRVPTLNDVYIEAGTALTADEFIAESLPNIKGETNQSGSATGAFVIGPNKTVFKYNGSTTATSLAFDASNSSSVYQDGAKVKPDSVRYRAMVQLANEATDEALITAASALQQVANKVDKTSATDRETVVGWGMPDYDNVVKIGLMNNNDEYTVPMDGYVFLTAAANKYASYYFDDQFIQIASYYFNSRHLYRVGKGTVIKKTDGTAIDGTAAYNAFVPCKGVNQ